MTSLGLSRAPDDRGSFKILWPYGHVQARQSLGEAGGLSRERDPGHEVFGVSSIKNSKKEHGSTVLNRPRQRARSQEPRSRAEVLQVCRRPARIMDGVTYGCIRYTVDQRIRQSSLSSLSLIRHFSTRDVCYLALARKLGRAPPRPGDFNL